MIEFEYPHLLWLLLLIPLLAAIYLLGRLRRRRELARFGRPEVIASLMPDVSRYMPAVKLSVELLLVAVLVLMVARPIATAETADDASATKTEMSGMEIMMCVDVSNSMLASATDDPSGMSRIQRTRLILEKLIDRLSGDKVGLIVFAGDAIVQLPITNDFISAKMFLGNIDPGMVPTQGTAIGAAIDMAVNCLDAESDFSKAIIVITDGENFEDDAAQAAKNAAAAGIRVDVIGVGTEKGAPIPVGNGKYMTYPDGREVITALNVKEAEAIAAAGDGIYISGSSNNAVKQLTENLSDMARKDYTRVSHSPAAEQFPVLAWIALLLAIIDVFILTRKISWLRKFNFFSKS